MQPVIIYPPTIDWDQLHQRPQQLLKALSQLGAVSIFCNLNIHARHDQNVERQSDTLFLANGIALEQAVAWARAAFPCSPVILYYTYPPHISWLTSLKADLIIFDSVDEPEVEFSNWQDGYLTSLSRADIILASARSLAERAGLLTDSPVYLVPNGCDFEHFSSAAEHQPLATPPFSANNPVIGYIGAIAPWLDWSLINTMARCLPGYEFVLIGSPLLQYGVTFTNKNMHYLGHKDYEFLPIYLSNFDFCLIPFKLTEMTRGVNPVKFWEYLASGKPILSTALPEIPQEYVTIVQEEMFPGFTPRRDETNAPARMQFARNNSWTARAEVLLGIIRDKLEHG